MEYKYATTDEMDDALATEAEKQGKTAEELFNIIVTADMGTLTRNHEAIKKDQVFEAYKQNSASKASIDEVILSSKPVKIEPIEPIDKIDKIGKVKSIVEESPL